MLEAFFLFIKCLLLGWVQWCNDGVIVVTEVLLVRINHSENCEHIISEAVRVDIKLTKRVQVLESFLQTEAFNDPILE